MDVIRFRSSLVLVRTKKKVIKLLKGQDNNANGIEQLGNIDPDIPWDNTERGCISFICGLYGNSGNKTLAEMRYSKWVEKSKSNTMTSVKDLEKFPPTVECRGSSAKYQACTLSSKHLEKLKSGHSAIRCRAVWVGQGQHQ